MKALMLAAGVGSRLYGDDYRQPPKSLLRFAGATLLERHIRVLQSVGVDELVMVLGYRHDEILAEVRAIGARDYVRSLYNPRFRGGPILSFWTAREVLREGAPVLFMDADVLYDPRLIERLVTSTHGNCFLLDQAIEPGDEPVKLCLRDGLPVDFGKKVEGTFDMIGEWPGFLTMTPEIAARMADAAQALVDEARMGVTYEVAMRDVLVSEPPGTFGVEDITGIPWIEIDFPADLLRAEKKILPRIVGPAHDTHDAAAHPAPMRGTGRVGHG